LVFLLTNTGEFVEGKEKLKLVVDKTFNGHRELHSSIFGVDTSTETDSQNGDDDIDFGEEFQFDSDLAHDIEELGEEEQKMLNNLEPESDETEITESKFPADVREPKSNSTIENAIGKSEDDAITLSDDEDEQVRSDKSNNDAAVPVQNVSTGTSNEKDVSEKPIIDSESANQILPKENILSGCRLYRIRLSDSNLGLEVLLYEGRIIVSRLRPERIVRYGSSSKPSVGDILVAVQGQALGSITSLTATLQYIKAVLQKPPIDLMFIEAPKFIERFRIEYPKTKQLQQPQAHQQNYVPNPVPNIRTPTSNILQPPSNMKPTRPLQLPTSKAITPEIIELLDD
jgi:hypothetical protein